MKTEKNLTFYRQNVLTTKNPSQPCLEFPPCSNSLVKEPKAQITRYSRYTDFVRTEIRSLEKGRGKVAFTLAEVLITLGIIGVVAALTIPNLVYEHQKKVVETRLQKFYSTINQAIKLAELDYGDRELWYNLNDVDYDKDGKPVDGEDAKQKWMNKYIVPYIQNENVSVSTFTMSGEKKPIIYFADGSAFLCSHPSHMADWYFYPGSPDKCVKKFGSPWSTSGKCSFDFSYSPSSSSKSEWKYVGRNFEPYKYKWDGTKEALYNGSNGTGGCNETKGAYCSTLIQYNGWKIPDDYPFRVSY